MAAYPNEVLSRWHTMIEGLQASPKDFFSSVEAAIKEKQLQGAKISRIKQQEGGVFSAHRDYLRVQRDELIYDLCGAPYGNGFFVSWWLGRKESGFWALLSSVPLVSLLARRMVKPVTYYKLDTASMFQSLVHSAVLGVVDDMTNRNGLKLLADSERKPVMKDFFAT